MNNMKKLGALAAACLGLAETVTAQEDYSTWSGHENIILNTKASGGNVPGNVTNYPVLVRLDSANASAIFTAAQSGGVDIRFGKPSGARLAFERERWDAAAKKAEFWVLLDTVKGNDSSAAFRIHWGKAGAADSSSSQSVFSGATGFLAVWHMNQAIAVAGDTLVDATKTGHKATVALEGGAAVVPVNVTTGIGIGKNFLGDFTAGTTITTGAYFLVDNTDSVLNINTSTGPFTLSAWANPAVCDATSRMGLLTKYGNVNTGPLGARAYALQTANVAGNWRLTMDPLVFAGTGTTTAITEFVADAACTENEWTYLAGSYTTNGNPPTQDAAGAENNRLFKANATGTEATIGFTATQQLQSVGLNANVYIGRIHNVDRFFRGGIDEVRISNVARSDDWKQLDYAIQKSGSQTIFVGVPPVGVAGPAARLSGFSIRAHAAGVRFLFPAGQTGLTDAKVSVTDISGRTIWSRRILPGAREFIWRRDATRAAPGLYLARTVVNGVAAAESKLLLP